MPKGTPPPAGYEGGPGFKAPAGMPAASVPAGFEAPVAPAATPSPPRFEAPATPGPAGFEVIRAVYKAAPTVGEAWSMQHTKLT